MSKWQKIQPDQIRVGDRVIVKAINQPDAYEFTVFESDITRIDVFATVNHHEWYIRKPKKAKPPTRPDEPPVGSFFRVDRTGIIYWKCGVDISFRRPLPPYQQMIPPAPSPGAVKRWELITEPGDTITLLELTEKGDKKDGGV